MITASVLFVAIQMINSQLQLAIGVLFIHIQTWHDAESSHPSSRIFCLYRAHPRAMDGSCKVREQHNNSSKATCDFDGNTTGRVIIAF